MNSQSGPLEGLNWRFLAYDQKGNTQIVEHISEVSIHDHGYIRLQYNNQESQAQLYYDFVFPIEGQPSVLHGEQVVYRRIASLYNGSSHKLLFPSTLQKSMVQFYQFLPHFVIEMRQFDIVTFRRLFLVQTITENGKYEVVINRDGNFEVETVDDFVPVYKDTQMPIWGLDYQQPWQLVIAKVWAKVLGGFQYVQSSKPFQFLEYFTPCTWRYFNLDKEGRSFLSKYSQRVGKSCRIFLKSKQQSQVQRCGIAGGKLAYQLIQFDEFKQKDKRQYNLLIRCLIAHQWTGALSIFDSNFKTVFKRLKSDYQLNQTFLLNQPDFFNIFASAYVTSFKRNYPEFITCYPFALSAKYSSSSKFFILQVKHEGYLILTIKQSQGNKVTKPVGGKNLGSATELGCSERYLQVKYLLAKINRQKKEETAIQNMLAVKESYAKIDYQTHLDFVIEDFDYMKGYNKGDAHPISITPGQYVFRIEAEPSKAESNFCIQCISQELIDIAPFEPSPTVRYKTIKQSFLSIADKVPKQELPELAIISFGKLYHSIGYDFIAIRTHRELKKRFVVAINPDLLRKEGFVLCLEHENKDLPFSLELQKREKEVIVLNRVVGQKNRKWPPTAIKFFQSKS